MVTIEPARKICGYTDHFHAVLKWRIDVKGLIHQTKSLSLVKKHHERSILRAAKVIDNCLMVTEWDFLEMEASLCLNKKS